MPAPIRSPLSPAAYAVLDRSSRVRLLAEYLEDLGERLCWVDEEMARHGICSICRSIGHEDFPHHCCEGRG
jgi:hypothetical protein